jgi:uncharacterized protein
MLSFCPFSVYYNGVLSGSYRQANLEKFNPAIDGYIKPFAKELKGIQTGKMSQEKYENLQ